MTIVTRESLTNLLKDDRLAERVVGKALVHLYYRQTSDEKSQETTKHHNLRGFTPADARMGTSMATQYLRQGYLSQKQVNYWRVTNKNGVMRLAKYWAQLNEEALKQQQDKIVASYRAASKGE